MKERQKRLHEVFQHLRKTSGIHTQTDFANALQYSRVYISAALNGMEKNLTDKLFESICNAFPGTFNIEYLLYGNGELLTPEESYMNDEAERRFLGEKLVQELGVQKASHVIDASSMVNAIISSHNVAMNAKDQTISSLEREMKQKDEQIADLRTRIIEKDDYIATLKARIAELQQLVAIQKNTDLGTYPFPVGVADDKKQRKNL